jgi:hypothetical protein
VITIAGPDISHNYPDMWGHLHGTVTDHCARFANFEVAGGSWVGHSRTPYAITIRDVQVDPPLGLLFDCASQGSVDIDPPCTAGFVLEPGGATSCHLGVQVPAELRGAEFTRGLHWHLSMDCTDTAAHPCNDAAMAPLHPTPDDPVEVRWTIRDELRCTTSPPPSSPCGEPRS